MLVDEAKLGSNGWVRPKDAGKCVREFVGRDLVPSQSRGDGGPCAPAHAVDSFDLEFAARGCDCDDSDCFGRASVTP